VEGCTAGQLFAVGQSFQLQNTPNEPWDAQIDIQTFPVKSTSSAEDLDVAAALRALAGDLDQLRQHGRGGGDQDGVGLPLLARDKDARAAAVSDLAAQTVVAIDS
jgi:hypothetical protein